MPESFYDLLGVDEDAETGEIKRAYRGKVRKYHPDVNPDERATEQFRAVKVAYETLRDDERRAAYDRLGHREFVEQRLGGRDVAHLVDRSGAGTGDRGATGADERSPTGTAGTAGTTRTAGSTTQSSTAASGTAASGTAASKTAASGTAASGTATSETAASGTAAGERTRGDRTQSDRRASGGDARRRRRESRGGAVDGTDARTERERAQVRRRIHRRKVVSRYGEPALAAATLLSFSCYLLGVSRFVGANRTGVDRAVAAVPAIPDEGLAALETGGVQSGLAFAAESVATASPGTAFPVAAALLPIALFATVLRLPARWRNPGWWLLPVAGAGPAAGLAVQYADPGALGAAAVAVLGFLAAPAVAALAWVLLLLSRL